MEDSTPMSRQPAAPPPAQSVAWGWLLVPALLQLVLHVATNGTYGIFRDEYYYLACASRPDWGYVDHPPLSIWILSVWRAIFGASVHSIRLLPALCGSALILLTGATAARLGGGRWAQLVAGAGSGIGAAGLVICGFYSMNCFDFLFWIGAYYLVIGIARDDDASGWPWLGLLLGVGLMNKVGLLVFGVSLALGLVATRLRRHLLDRRLYLAGALALLFLLPYLLWNQAHDWPTLEFIENAKRYKIAEIPPLGFFAENVLEANPVTLPLWLGGLGWLLAAPSARRFRIVALIFVATWVLLVLQKSKPYYFATSIPVMLAAGGVAWERWTAGRRWCWARWVMAASLLAGMAVFAPLGLPLLAPERLDAYQRKLGIVPNTGEVGHDAALPQYFSDRLGWDELARAVARVHASLPEEERRRALVLGRNYGHSGALEYWSDRYDLPPVYGRHNNYWLWGPPALDERGVVLLINFDPADAGKLFEQVEIATVVETRWAQEERMTVLVCRGLNRPVEEVWAGLKIFI
jgi:hypothetical protein